MKTVTFIAGHYYQSKRRPDFMIWQMLPMP